MIDVKKAAQIAATHFADLYPDQNFSNLLLEEVEYDEDENVWLITLGFTDPVVPEKNPSEVLGIPLLPSSPVENRRYKIFSIDAENGNVYSMKIRSLAHA